MAKKKDIVAELGVLIGERAKIKFKSNVEFAQTCDLGEATIRRVLIGKQNISVTVLKKICHGLEIKISDLFQELGY